MKHHKHCNIQSKKEFKKTGFQTINYNKYSNLSTLQYRNSMVTQGQLRAYFD